jgi:hypothetical protein
MTNNEYQTRLYELINICEINQLYHQRLEWRFGFADKALKIIVGVLAVAGAVLAVPGIPTSWTWAAFIVASLSAVFAVALNIIPVGDKEKSHGEMFRLWSDLLKDALQEEHKTCEMESGKDVPKSVDEHLRELIGKKECLNASESAAWPKLLLRCQGDVNERKWGDGIRTFEQAEEERARRESGSPTTSAC